MTSRKPFNALEESRRRQQTAREKILSGLPKKAAKIEHPRLVEPGPEKEVKTEPVAIKSYSASDVPFFRDDELLPCVPSKALRKLVDLYLNAAQNRTRHIALAWPASLRTLTVVHALATVERWATGNKKGVRGAIYPVNSHVFYPLNHIHYSRSHVLHYAKHLAESQSQVNAHVTHGFSSKDSYLFWLADLGEEAFDPAVGELLPHFLAEPGFDRWAGCERRLLSHVVAKLQRRGRKANLRSNCELIGSPSTAPDALFALDGRMETTELRAALKQLRELGQPEVVLVDASRFIRKLGAGWKRPIARFCLLLEEVFPDSPPGVVIVTDEPHAAYGLRAELLEMNKKRDKSLRWKSASEYSIAGVLCTLDRDGLLDPGEEEVLVPRPIELDVAIIDAEAAIVINKLFKVARNVASNKDTARPIADAASYLTLLAALPCGVKQLVEWLASAEVESSTRIAFDWQSYVAGIRRVDQEGGAASDRKVLMDCIQRGSELFGRYYEATPFALKLASLVAQIADSKKRRVVIVFTSALYRRLAERFLEGYADYPGGVAFSAFSSRVSLIIHSQLNDNLDELGQTAIVFAGINDSSLRIVLSDNRIPPHTTLLLTQRGGQYLRSSLRPIAEKFEEFRAFKPRIESILRQLISLPEDASVLVSGDYVLPAFRIELASNTGDPDTGPPKDAWRIVLDTGQSLYRSPSQNVYVYDPASSLSSDWGGFRPCTLQHLRPGDKLFVMSAELREQVETVLKDAGIDIQHDKAFEGALRSYHEQVLKKLSERFPVGAMREKVLALRAAILSESPDLAKGFPGDQAIRQWIDLGSSQSTQFDQLRPQAPRQESHFKAFASALGFAPIEASYLWQRVINPVRNVRRVDGRQVSDIYSYMLLQPEEAMVHSNIDRKVLNQLFDKARASVVVVDSIVPNKEAPE